MPPLYNSVMNQLPDIALLDGTDCCTTKYPILLVHGIMSLDIRDGFMWGRIPRTLRSYGAVVRFGNQDGIGSCATNALQLKQAIDKYLDQTGAEKVNIIAHSKGGLDVRALLELPGAASLVASVTTLSTPHRGLKTVDRLDRIPKVIAVPLCAVFNVLYRVLGDEHPDLRAAFHDVSFSACCRRHDNIHQQAPDKGQIGEPTILCQSFAGSLPRLKNDPVAFCTYHLVSRYDGPNDGVVPIESTPWGEFRGVLDTAGHRGLSHFDLQDRWRRDFPDFDVPLFYAALVAELKQHGL